VSKATTVRKKALDLVRQQDWQGAIREYKRLVEMDQSNPNVHNELADIYLKTSAKAEAYDCFVRAIDEYTRVGLYNNAVAVAKKVMRVLPARTEVLTLLGNVRMKQGLTREAESYYTSFLDKVAGSSIEASAFKTIAREIGEAAPESVPVLQRLSQCLLSFQLDEDAGEILIKLHGLVQRNGNAELLEQLRGSIEKLGLGGRIAMATGAGAAPDPNRTVVTEQNIWTKSHSAGERIEIESTPQFTPRAADAAPASAPPGDAPVAKAPPAAPAGPPKEAAPPAAPPSDGPSEKELYLLRLARGVGGTSPQPRDKKEKEKQENKKGAKPARHTQQAAASEPAPNAAGATPAAEPAAPDQEPVAAQARAEAPAAQQKAAASAPGSHDAPPSATAATDTMPRPAPAQPAPPPAAKPAPQPPAAKPAPAPPAAKPAPQPPAAKPAPAPPAAKPAPAPPSSRPASGDHTQISALIDNDMDGGQGEADYRSHYDLGMAYMEMDLLSEAIREYQAASKSPQFQVKCLEMIGLCFVRQNLPQLAIKQLSKGLSIIGDESEESLGMKYNLGLAYEMVGDLESARAQFEDVYVVDVTFRDVAEKVARLAHKS